MLVNQVRVQLERLSGACTPPSGSRCEGRSAVCCCWLSQEWHLRGRSRRGLAATLARDRAGPGAAPCGAGVGPSVLLTFVPTGRPQIVRQEALISDARKPQLRKLIYKLIEKQVRTRAGNLASVGCGLGCCSAEGHGTRGSASVIGVNKGGQSSCRSRPAAPLPPHRSRTRTRASTSSRSCVRTFCR